jgi:hypothetical protein
MNRRALELTTVRLVRGYLTEYEKAEFPRLFGRAAQSSLTAVCIWNET